MGWTTVRRTGAPRALRRHSPGDNHRQRPKPRRACFAVAVLEPTARRGGAYSAHLPFAKTRTGGTARTGVDANRGFVTDLMRSFRNGAAVDARLQSGPAASG